MEALALAQYGSCCHCSGLCPTRKIMNALDRCGLTRCAPSWGPQILQITLLSVTNTNLPSGFYFEVAAEPASGQPKISRIHKTPGDVVDLNDELLELDWFGDEKEVSIHLMECSNKKQSQDAIKGEITVPRAMVNRYAKEARGHDREVQFGSRRFQMVLPHEALSVARKKRFQDMLLPSGAIFDRMVKGAMSRIGEENGLEVASPEEMEKLREENQSLRVEHTELRTKANGYTALEGNSASAFSPQAEDLYSASLAVRFQLLPKRHMAHEADQDFRKASFQSDD